MLISDKTIVSMSDANQNFSRVAHIAEEQGTVVVFKNNKPKYIIIDIERSGILDNATGNEVEDIAVEYLATTKWL